MRKLRVVQTLLVVCAVATAAVLLGQSGIAQAHPAGVAHVSKVKTTKRATSCTNTGTVVIMYYQSAVPPTSNGCWSYYRPLGADLSTFKTCSIVTGRTYGTGSLYIYDDTNPAHLSPTDYQYITQTCPKSTSLWGEFMAAAGGNWTTVSGVSATRYYKELYTCDTCRDAYSPGYVGGFAPVPVVNVEADTTAAQVNTDIAAACKWYTDPPPGTVWWVSLYANATMDSTKVGWVNTALNNCYH
jgi:hypothetical protein